MKSKKPLIPYLVWMAAFVVIPLGMVFYFAFTDGNGHLTLENFRYIGVNSQVYLDSFKVAFLSTLICLVLAYPLALIMSRMSPRAQRMMNILIMLPMWMNFILRICSLDLIFRPTGILNQLLSLLGLGGNAIYQTPTAVVIGIVYNYLPFMVLPIYTVMAKISRSLIEAGQDLGCNGFQLLKKVIFPLSLPGVISGITMVFVPAASSFVISARLGGFNLIGDTIEAYYKGEIDMHAGGMLSFVLMLVIVISIAVMNHFDKDDDIVLV
ncbi:MAG: ABC transporter permease [Clostridia bacterium]|nr:ABC transporter permease [Clostridia bacterium]